jgi:hypothetical protein
VVSPIDAAFDRIALIGGLWPTDRSVFARPFDVSLFLRLDDRLASDDEWFSLRNLVNNSRDTTLHFLHVPSAPSGASSGVSSGTAEFHQAWSPAPSWVGGRDGITCITGNSNSWAMCVDNRNGVTVLGLDRSVAATQRVIFQNNWMTASEAANAIGDDATRLSERYAPSPWFTTPSALNPLWRKWCFVCHVDREDDKLFYRPQFEQLFAAIDPLIARWPFRRMLSSQARWRRVGGDDALRITGTEAPVGGWQNFTPANCHKVATKFLTDNQHLQLRFDGRADESAALYPRQPPGLIDLSFFWLRAARTPRRSPDGPAELYLVMPDSGRTRADPCNQYFELFALGDALNVDDLERVVDQLAVIGRATAIHQTSRPHEFYELDRRGSGQISSIYSCGPASIAPDGTPIFTATTWQLHQLRSIDTAKTRHD